MASNIDPTQPPEGNASTAAVRANMLAAKNEIEQLQTAQAAMRQLGEAVYTVGPGGYFASLKDAAEWLAGQPGMDALPGLTGTVEVSQYGAVITGTNTNFSQARPGDLILITGDGDAGSFISSAQYHWIRHISTDTKLQMQEGFFGPSGAGKTYSIHRPRRYTFFILGELSNSDFTADVIAPLGADVTFDGLNAGLLWADNAIGYGIRYPRCGRFALKNLTKRAATGRPARVFDADITSEPLAPALGCSIARVDAANLTILTSKGSTGNPLQLHGGHVHASRIVGDLAGGLCNITAGSFDLSDIACDVGTSAADIIVTSQFRSSAFAVNPSFARDFHLHRAFAYTVGAGSLFELNDLVQNKEVFCRDLIILDDNQPAPNPNCMQANVNQASATGVKIYLENSVIRQAGLGHGLNVGVNATVYTRNVHTGAGGAIDTAGDGTITPF